MEKLIINQDTSLDKVIYNLFKEENHQKTYDEFKNDILIKFNIDEMNYYTNSVNSDLIKYIRRNIFPLYEKNDGGHNLFHINEVIRRIMALNETFNLDLDKNMLYTMAACHDLDKYVDSKTHHILAAKKFMEFKYFNTFFNENEIKIIEQAIKDHRSSKEDKPASIYGEILSSADRNTTIKLVFVRSFLFEQEKKPDMIIEDYLEYTRKRLETRYSEEDPENMFFEDMIYKEFLNEIRNLVKDKEQFDNEYCKVNNIGDKTKTLDMYKKCF